MAIGGGVVLAIMGYLQITKALGAIDSSNKPTTTPVEWAVIAGGSAMLLSPIFFRTDPLSDEEREALVGQPPRVTVGAAPLPGGGALSVAVRF